MYTFNDLATTVTVYTAAFIAVYVLTLIVFLRVSYRSQEELRRQLRKREESLQSKQAELDELFRENQKLTTDASKVTEAWKVRIDEIRRDGALNAKAVTQMGVELRETKELLEAKTRRLDEALTTLAAKTKELTEAEEAISSAATHVDTLEEAYLSETKARMRLQDAGRAIIADISKSLQASAKFFDPPFPPVGPETVHFPAQENGQLQETVK